MRRGECGESRVRWHQIVLLCVLAVVVLAGLVHPGSSPGRVAVARAAACDSLRYTLDPSRPSIDPGLPPQPGSTASLAPFTAICDNGASADSVRYEYCWDDKGRSNFGDGCTGQWSLSRSRTFTAADLSNAEGRSTWWGVNVRAFLADGTRVQASCSGDACSGLVLETPSVGPGTGLWQQGETLSYAPGDKVMVWRPGMGGVSPNNVFGDSWGGYTYGSGTPYRYQWQRCTPDLASCAAISGAAKDKYVIDDPDVGQRLRYQVTGPNGQLVVSLATATIDPPPPPVGVSILEGADFTNTPEVVLTITAPEQATRVIISNDGGFANAVRKPIDGTRKYAWTLRSTGPERLPKSVYVRFSGGGDNEKTFTDDIILDETKPTVVSAQVDAPALTSLDGGRTTAASQATKLRLEARDNLSGVWKMQFNSAKGKWVPYKTRVTVTVKPTRVRVMDRAKNISRWRTVTR